MSKPPQTQPSGHAHSMRQALDESEPLGRLMQRMQVSRECFAAIIVDLPDGLRQQVQPGPLDESGWVLLATNGAAAAKLRQLLPRFEERLRAAGIAASPVSVKVLAQR